MKKKTTIKTTQKLNTAKLEEAAGGGGLPTLVAPKVVFSAVLLGQHAPNVVFGNC